MQRFAIREGWSTVFLTGMVVFVAVWSIQRADWADGLGILNLVTLVGLASGVLAAKWRWGPTALGHLASLLLGALVVVWQMTNYLDDRLGGRRDKLAWLWGRAERWAGTIWNGEQAEDLYLFVLFISALTFLLAYGSMWFVLRARWIWAALVFPGLLLFINLGYSLRVPNSYVVLYIFFSVLLLVRFTLLERETLWRRMRMEFPGTLAWRGMWIGTWVALLVLVFGWAFPASARSGRAHDAWLSVDGPWRSVERQFNEWFAGLNGPGRRGIGGFASFSDSFDLGGPLRLSDTPVVLVSGEAESPYLAAHRYSIYTGRGWESELTVDEDDAEAQRQLPPQVELRAGEAVDSDPALLEHRETTEYNISVQRPRGSLIFAPETFGSADIGVNLVLTWDTYTNATFDLQDGDPASVPPELGRLIQLLRDYDFTPPAPEPTPTVPATRTPTVTPTPLPPTPAPPRGESEAIRAERIALQERGIQTTYTVNITSYQADELTFSGQFPNYDDVEAVYAREGLSTGQQYSVVAHESNALSDELRATPPDYPRQVTDRYLQLPETVTQRTRDLAALITADAATTYDMAAAVESWLRQNIAYVEDVEFPPEDQDVVDYVLFDSREGYCEYYASAFVVMLRSLGVPTRMVTGFFPADRDAELGGFLYRERNAHAWPEVYFAGHGWVPFEPTAARSQFNREPVVPGQSTERPNPGIIGGDNILPDDSEFLDPDTRFERGGGIQAPVQSRPDPVTRAEWAVRLLFLLAMAGTLLVLFLWLRGMRGLTPATQLYTKLGRGASWSGVRATPSMTPHEYAHSLARSVPGSRAPATYLADVYVRERYGNRPPAQTEMLRARQAWLRLRGLLVKHFFLRLRPWRAGPVEEEDDGDW